MGRKHTRWIFWVVAVGCVLLVGAGKVSAIAIEMVPVGNPGNAADPLTGYGSVGYAYSIGKYDVTVSQYTAFLNAVAVNGGFYDSWMSSTTKGNPGITRSGSQGSYTYSVASGRDNRPMTRVTFWDALRFANWLDNGQPTALPGSGTTETGAYTITSDGIGTNTITRNSGARWALASENEWYKAAYYSPALNADNGGYWLYPTQSNSISTAQANYVTTGIGDTTDVGSYPYPSYYGTLDQGGNVFQWNESIVSDSSRDFRGGAFTFGGGALQSSSRYYYNDPSYDDFTLGFRVVQLPEPASLSILGLGAIGMLVRRRKAA